VIGLRFLKPRHDRASTGGGRLRLCNSEEGRGIFPPPIHLGVTEPAPGLYLAVYHGALSHFRWLATSNITVVSPHSRTTMIEVSGSGSIYVVGEPGAALQLAGGTAVPLSNTSLTTAAIGVSDSPFEGRPVGSRNWASEPIRSDPKDRREARVVARVGHSS